MTDWKELRRRIEVALKDEICDAYDRITGHSESIDDVVRWINKNPGVVMYDHTVVYHVRSVLCGLSCALNNVSNGYWREHPGYLDASEREIMLCENSLTGSEVDLLHELFELLTGDKAT